MNDTKQNNIQLTRSIIILFWLGFFTAISFMEAPLKFTAPNLSLAEGLQVGKIVFSMLNNCEWVFLVAVLITCLIKKPGRAELSFIICAGIILLLETIWLLPVLDADADKIIAGQLVTGTNWHWCYVALEIIKLPVLLLAGIKGLRSVAKSSVSVTIQ